MPPAKLAEGSIGHSGHRRQQEIVFQPVGSDAHIDDEIEP